jgi:purine-binding chemotaxis protein CheW
MSKTKTSEKNKELQNKIEQAKKLVQLNKKTKKTDIASLLKKRAVEAAKTNEKKADTTETISVLELLLGKENYAIKTEYLKEINVTKKITEIPCTPEYIYGVINIRGNIISVIDLKKFLRLNYVGINDNASVVVIDYNGVLVAIVADEVIGIKNIDTKKIQKEKPDIVKISDQYIQGITDETVVILDINKILSEESLLVNEKVI